ncbi:MAG: Ig-like domain-containing protein [Lachnospiraceae bacterium]|nr:Ig-like domain-containing protein [Lachnospiraceae bacterium]
MLKLYLKKILVSIVLLSLLIQPFYAFASENISSEQAGTAIVTVDSVEADPGDTINIPVRITTNPGFAGLCFAISCPDSLSLSGITAGELLAGGSFTGDKNSSVVQWYDPYAEQNITGTGILFTLAFKVGDNAKAGKYKVEAGLKDGKASNFTNIDYNNVAVSFESGEVTVKGTEDPTKKLVESIELDTSSFELEIGKARQISASVLPKDAADPSLTWESNDETIATVSSGGLVTAVADGTAVITAKANDGSGKSADCTVTVKTKKTDKVLVSSITFAESSINLALYESRQLVAAVLPENAENKDITWESSDPDIVSINQNGRIAGLKTGTARITVTAKDGSGVSGSCDVTVVEGTAVESGTLDGGLSWRLSGNDSLVLIISGNGAIPDFYSTNPQPWTGSKDKIVSAVIEDGVTCIGYETFKGLDKLQGVFMADSITRIKMGAFEKCVGLTDVTLSEGLIELSSYAFGSCSELESVYIPRGIQEIGERAFIYCDNLRAIYYGGSKQEWFSLISGIDLYGDEDCELYKAGLIYYATDLGEVGERTVLPDLLNHNDDLTEAKEKETTGLFVANLKTSYEYTGSPVVPEFRIYNNTSLLREKKDYKVSFKNNTNVGTADIKLTGAGDYSGTETLQFRITPVNLEDSGEVFAESIKKGNTQKINVYWHGMLLKQNKDYSYSLTSDGGLIITGLGNFTGNYETDPVEKGFVSISKAKITVSSETYTGEAVEPTISVRDNRSGRTLEKDRDYAVTCISNVNAGTATAYIRGLEENGYTGVVKKTFKITAAKLKNEDVIVNYETGYTKGGAKPEPLVFFSSGDRTWLLREGVDYTLSYKNNKNISQPIASVQVKGTGNYTGSITKNFTVRQTSLKDLTAYCQNVVYDPTKTGKYYQILPSLIDKDGKLLQNGKDFRITSYTMTDIDTYEEIELTAGTPANKFELYSDITINIEGIGGYSGKGTLSYYIVEDSGFVNLAKARIDKIPVQSYTGSVVKPEVTVAGVDRSSFNLKYYNNVHKGTATVYVAGDHDATLGIKALTFKITAKKFKF